MHLSQQKIALEEIITKWEAENYAADSVFRRYYKGRRYIGARDRRVLQTGFYCYLRYKTSIDELVQQYDATNKAVNRADMAFYLSGAVAKEALLAEGAEKLPDETDLTQISPAVNMPDFLYQQLQVLPDSMALMQAMQQQAPITLRCESLDDVESLYQRLHGEEIAVTKGVYSPFALQIGKRLSNDFFSGKDDIHAPNIHAPNIHAPNIHAPNIHAPDYQDEGAQIVALLSLQAAVLATTHEGKKHARILDFCAGSGGKLLAMNSFAPYIADDVTCNFVALNIDASNREKLKIRLKNYQNGKLEAKIYHNAQHIKRKFHLVLADVPCSLIGTLRRNPDRKWKLTPEKLNDLQTTQASILQQAAGKTADNGFVCYVTCSLLPCENQDIIKNFLESDEGKAFQPVSASAIAPDLCQKLQAGTDSPYLQLRPDRHGCDGFFIAFLQKSSKATGID
ncbi:MAG: RsmB/NOP family class I SAM-dependent RNA methyltransferase [Alphaproteobacteria bacterium]|nr:RsmB/NOP family class I SAM-dependent RNA methyltransferase [Alphaproteobacteria bacterium]